MTFIEFLAIGSVVAIRLRPAMLRRNARLCRSAIRSVFGQKESLDYSLRMGPPLICANTVSRHPSKSGFFRMLWPPDTASHIPGLVLPVCHLHCHNWTMTLITAHRHRLIPRAQSYRRLTSISPFLIPCPTQLCLDSVCLRCICSDFFGASISFFGL